MSNSLVTRWLLFFVVGYLSVACGACSGFFDPAPDLDISRQTYYEYRRLPEERDELVAMARKLAVDEAMPEEMARALLASCRAIELDPQHKEAHFLAAYSCGWLQDFGEPTVCYDTHKERTRVADCVDLAKRAAYLDPRNARTQYAMIINIGLKLEHASIAQASTLIGPLMKTLKRTIKLDETLDEGGPLRILGALYLKAPPWPTGPGDLDKALELLERAVTNHPEHPLNHLFMAEAMLEDESPEDALVEVDKARLLLDPEKYSWRVERWRRRVDKVERRIVEAMEE